MTDAEIKQLAAGLSDSDMRRLRRELIYRFDARMDQLMHHMRQHEEDIHRLAMGNFANGADDASLIMKLADFALFFFVTDDNRSFVNDLHRHREDHSEIDEPKSDG